MKCQPPAKRKSQDWTNLRPWNSRQRPRRVRAGHRWAAPSRGRTARPVEPDVPFESAARSNRSVGVPPDVPVAPDRAVPCAQPTADVRIPKPVASRTRANAIALLGSSIRSGERAATMEPIPSCGTVWLFSMFAAQSASSPSSGARYTSDPMSRMVVIGATVKAVRKAIAESRVRISTGRRLSGALDVYHRTSPRLMTLPRLARPHRRQTPRAREDAGHIAQHVSSPSGRGHAVAGQVPVPHVYGQ